MWYCPNLSLEACVVAFGSSAGVVTSLLTLCVNTALLVLSMHYALCFCEDSSLALLGRPQQSLVVHTPAALQAELISVDGNKAKKFDVKTEDDASALGKRVSEATLQVQHRY